MTNKKQDEDADAGVFARVDEDRALSFNRAATGEKPENQEKTVWAQLQRAYAFLCKTGGM